MAIQIPEDTTQYEKETIGSCIKFLITTPDALTEFLHDLKQNHHKKWHLYKATYSEIRSQALKGRAFPERKKNGGIPIHKTEELAKQYDRTKQDYIPLLHLGYLDSRQARIRKIMTSDCSPQIKAELLEANI